MKRRSFFKNLVGSVAVLVTAYAKPFQRVEQVSMWRLEEMMWPVDPKALTEDSLATYSRLLIKQGFKEEMGNVFREVKS